MLTLVQSGKFSLEYEDDVALLSRGASELHFFKNQKWEQQCWHIWYGFYTFKV